MNEFDYVQWAEETRSLVNKYNTVTPSLENLLKFIVFKSRMGDLAEAERLKHLVEKQVQASGIYQSRITDVPSLPVPHPSKSDGDIVLGTLFQGERVLHEFRIPLTHFNRHVAIFASAGHGKTTLLINLLHQLLEHRITFLAFDFKQDFRHLTHLPIICLRWNWLRINPFRPPPGVDEFQWLSLVCDLFAHVYGWFHASKNYLYEFVNEQYQREKEHGAVSLEQVKAAIDASQDREFERQRMKTVVLNRLSTLLSVCHEVLDCKEGFPIEELLRYPVVIEMDGCASDEANFLVGLFLLFIFEYRKASQERGTLTHVIAFDEAHRLFYRMAQYRETNVELAPSVIDDIPREIRDYNEGLIFATQQPSQITNAVMANADTKLTGYLGDGTDIETIEKSYHVSREDAALIKRLTLGQFLVQKSGVNDGAPFLLQGDDYPVKKTVTNDALRDRMKDFIAKMQDEPKQTSGTMADDISLPVISEKASRILEHVGRTPLRNISQRYKELKLHPLDGKNAVKELHEKKLVTLRPIQLSAGRPSIYLELTQLGSAILAKKGVDLSQWNDYVGHTSLEHRVYQTLIASSLRKLGYTVEKEFRMEGKRFDVYAEKGNEKLGIEVCVSPKTNFFEASKVSTRLSEVLYVCRDITVVALMEKELASLGIDNSTFKFVVAHRYLSELYSLVTQRDTDHHNATTGGLPKFGTI